MLFLSGGAAVVEGPSSFRSWNPLSASRSSSIHQPGDEMTTATGLGEDLLDPGDVFQPFEPLIAQDQWTLPKLFQAEIDDDLPYVSVNTTQEIESRRRIEYVANKLNISCGKTTHQSPSLLLQSSLIINFAAKVAE